MRSSSQPRASIRGGLRAPARDPLHSSRLPIWHREWSIVINGSYTLTIMFSAVIIGSIVPIVKVIKRDRERKRKRERFAMSEHADDNDDGTIIIAGRRNFCGHR